MGARNETCRASLGGMALLVQILVVVATTQTGTLRIEVGQGFIWTAIGHECLDPRMLGRSPHGGFASVLERG